MTGRLPRRIGNNREYRTMTGYTKCVRIPPDVYEKANAAAEERSMAFNAYMADVLEREAGRRGI